MNETFDNTGVALSRWPHRTSMLLMCATFPLIWVGGLVTTYRAGMAVPDWPTTYGYNLFLYPWQTWVAGPFDLFIEHGHRLLGALVGLLTISLVCVLWKYEERKWLRRASWVALAAVIFQGVLGGMRVIENEVQLAKLHGCFGPLFFALCVAMTVFTSRFWREAGARVPHAKASALHRLAIMTTVLAYVQLVVGAHLRHLPVDMKPNTFSIIVVFHLILAAALLAHGVALAIKIGRGYRDQKRLLRPALALVILLFGQLFLGGATWVAKYAWPFGNETYQFAAGHLTTEFGLPQALTVTAHVALGSLILVTSLVVALRSLRLICRATDDVLVKTEAP